MPLEIGIQSWIIANGSPRLPRDIAIFPFNLELPGRFPVRRHLMLQDRLHSILRQGFDPVNLFRGIGRVPSWVGLIY